MVVAGIVVVLGVSEVVDLVVDKFVIIIAITTYVDTVIITTSLQKTGGRRFIAFSCPRPRNATGIKDGGREVGGGECGRNT